MEKTTFSFTGLVGMATLSKKIMTVLFCIAFLTLASSAGAQQAGQVSFEQFENFSISDAISIRDLLELENNWDYLKQSLGTPVEENCRDGNDFMGIEPTCDFLYDGLEIAYGSVGSGVELAYIELTNSAHFLQYQNTEFRVGDPIFKLEDHFPDAYNNRGSYETPRGETFHNIKITVGESVSVFSFKYHPTTHQITQITFLQLLT